MARAVVFNACADLFIVSLLLFVGLGLFAYYDSFPQQLAGGISGDRVLPYYIVHVLPAGVSGLLITAIFAAAMSSMDSGVNSMTTVLVSDFVRPLRRRQRTEHDDVKLARRLTLALGALATGVAFYVSGIEQILKASSAFLGLFGGPILALFLLGMLTRRASFRGWLVGVLVATTATVWLQYGTEVHFIHYFPFCFGTCALIGYAASVLIGMTASTPMAERQLTIWGRGWPD
jgi:Na+/proline symporter